MGLAAAAPPNGGAPRADRLRNASRASTLLGFARDPSIDPFPMPNTLARFKLLARPETLAVVDLGSNSFRLEIGRVEGSQIFRLDTWRETIRFGAGIDDKGNLTLAARKSALACLSRFRERLSGLQPSAVRAVATNTFRVARNAKHLPAAGGGDAGFPIDIIGGHEEARLIYLGVTHVLPASDEPRLVIDIGGGSTEFIIGRGMVPERLESLKLGCVSMTREFFPSGVLRASAFREAETHARAEIEAIASEFGPEHWKEAFASSGTALAIAAILEESGLSSGGSRPMASRGCAADDRGGPLRPARARGREARARAGARRRLRRDGRCRGRVAACPASIPWVARCAWACSTICSGEPSSETAAP